MNGLRRALVRGRGRRDSEGAKVMREVAREDDTDQILRKAALDVSCDDAANTLKKVVAFQSDSEDDDVREAPAPAPERPRGFGTTLDWRTRRDRSGRNVPRRRGSL